MSQPVLIRYDDGSTVTANNLADALVHLAHTGAHGAEDVVEYQERGVCEACGGSGVEPESDPPVVLSRDGIDDRVAQIREHSAGGDFDALVKAARKTAKE